MNLKQALTTIATTYNLDAGELIAYAAEDEIGGYHPEKQARKWPTGSLWEVEGKILYALVRALKPKNVLEVGSFHGASTTHIAEAILKNGSGKITCVDIAFLFEVRSRYKGIIKHVKRDVMAYTFPSRSKFDFVFEDALHTTEQVAHVWGQFAAKGAKGGVIISHDAMHFAVGRDIMAGIETVTSEALGLLVEPSDCGVAIWKK